MKILHTADWHLGKYLEGESRLDEQAAFLKDFVALAHAHKPDIIVIAGDVYDTPNPPSKAENLFYETLKQLSRDGDCLTVVIAGNHDNPDRLTAAGPLAKEHGILMFGLPKTKIEMGTYGKHEVVASGEGFVEVRINGEAAVLAAVAYPSEKRLNEVLYQTEDSDNDRALSYSERLKVLFENLAQHFREDSINLLISHLFAMNTQEAGSERGIQLGGSYMIGPDCFPKSAQYIALGHVHKPQVVPGTQRVARYSGSPLHYNRKEMGQQKSVLLVELKPQMEPVITELPLKVYKPIEVWRAVGMEDARRQLEAAVNRACWVYLEIETDSWIREDEIKQLRQLKPDLLEIKPLMKQTSEVNVPELQVGELSFNELFKAFYQSERQVEPTDDLIALLDSILTTEDEAEVTT